KLAVQLLAENLGIQIIQRRRHREHTAYATSFASVNCSRFMVGRFSSPEISRRAFLPDKKRQHGQRIPWTRLTNLANDRGLLNACRSALSCAACAALTVFL